MIKLPVNFHYSLRFEMIFACFVISIIPILIMQTVFYSLNRYYMEQKIDTLTSTNLSYIKSNIESDMEYYDEILYRIDSDDTITQAETNLKKGSLTDRELALVKLRDTFASYADIRDEVIDITFVDSKLESAFYDKKSISVDNYVWNAYSPKEKRQIYNKILKSDKIVTLGTKRYFFNNEANYLYSVGIKAWNLRTGENLGVVMLSIDESHLQKVCNINSGHEKAHAVNDFSFIIDGQNRIISFPNKRYIGRTIKKNPGENNYDLSGVFNSISMNKSDGIIINSTPVSGAGWRIVNLIDKSSMFSEINSFWTFTMNITLLIILFCIVLIFVFSNKFYKSVNDIVLEIKKAKKGDFSAHIKLKRESELVFISNEFNEMILKVNGLVENLKKQNEYIYEISNKRREAEINAIVAQINPHFLYNTLDCINWMLIKSENYDASKMVGNLADILRYSIPNINDQVTIQDAVNWLEEYLYLHKVRFNYSFRSEFIVEEGVLSCKIYKLLLQPIVENAVLHGFKGCTGGKLLTIKIAKFEENRLKIEIVDDGNGIPEEKLSHLLDEAASGGIGIKNVNERLKIYYHDVAQLLIESEENIGTKVTVIIPFVI